MLFYLFLYTLSFSTKVNTNPVHKSDSNYCVENTQHQKIKGYFNSDDLEDYIVLDKNESDIATLTIFLKKGTTYSKKVSFEITNDDFENVSDALDNLFITNPQKGEFVIGASCCGSFKTTETSHYKFYEALDTWILYKIVIGTVEADFIPNTEMVYQDFSTALDGKARNNEQIRFNQLKLFMEQSQLKLNSLLEKYKTENNSKTLSKISGDLSFNDLAEILANIPLNNKEYITKYNDLAYYLGLTKDGKVASIFLLKKIIKKDPDRIVAYLNLADAQWGIEQFDNAKKSYQKYISLMKSQNKDLNKIPLRVKERS